MIESRCQKLDRSRIPGPIFEDNPRLVKLYWLAWEQAWDHVVERTEAPQSPYMDEAFDPDYQTKGMYWRGGVWLPTAYMATKALERYGYGTLADETAARLLHHIARTYEDYEPHTIWECYQPEAPLPATGKDNVYRVRPDFCGWSALGPISLLIENVLGFHTIDAPRREVRWRKHQPGRHGIRGLRFGEVATDIVALDESTIEVHANAPYTLIINNRPYAVRPGYQTLRLDPIRA